MARHVTGTDHQDDDQKDWRQSHRRQHRGELVIGTTTILDAQFNWPGQKGPANIRRVNISSNSWCFFSSIVVPTSLAVFISVHCAGQRSIIILHQLNWCMTSPSSSYTLIENSQRPQATKCIRPHLPERFRIGMAKKPVCRDALGDGHFMEKDVYPTYNLRRWLITPMRLIFPFRPWICAQTLAFFDDSIRNDFVFLRGEIVSKAQFRNGKKR